MAVDSVIVARMATHLALAHIAVGLLLICFGIADWVVQESQMFFVGFGIWIGAWMCTTGGLGIPRSSRDITCSRNALAGVFMGFSITSAVFGGIIIFFYSVSLNGSDYGKAVPISAIILLLGIAEFGIGIWAAVCCCMMSPCCACCGGAVPQHQLYFDNTTGYITTRVVGGYPVATPVQVGGGMVAVSQAQAAQLPIGRVPAPGGVGGHPAMVQAGATTGMPATVSYPQEPMKPPPHHV